MGLFLSDFMGFFEDFIRNIRQEAKIEQLNSEINLLVEKLKLQTDIIYNSKKNDLDKATKIVELEKRLNDLMDETILKNLAIDKLKTELALTGEIITPEPEFLDQSKTAYGPYQRVEGEDVYLTPSEPYDADTQLKFWVRSNNIRSLSKNEKLMKIWDYVIKALVYKLDSQVDNWQFPAQTLHRGKGDCEDGTILFISTCKVAGIRPDEVFNAVGMTEGFGLHSYPIIKFDKDEKLGTDGISWYICETTLDKTPLKPKKLLGSIYHTESYGLANWKFYGRIKADFVSLFNFSGPMGSEKERRIMNSAEKRKYLNEYWKVK